MNIILEDETGRRALSATVPALQKAPDVLTWQGRSYRFRGSFSAGATYREAEVMSLDAHLPGGGMVIHPSHRETRTERA